MTATTETEAPAAAKPEDKGNDTETRVGPMHEAFAAYIKENKGVDITPEQVFAVTSTRVAFRKSESYTVGVKAAKERQRQEAEAAKEAAKAEREAERARKAEEKAAEKKAADDKKAAEKAAADKAAAEKTSEGALAEANAKSEGKDETPPKKTGKAAAGQKAKTESPF